MKNHVRFFFSFLTVTDGDILGLSEKAKNRRKEIVNVTHSTKLNKKRKKNETGTFEEV